MKLQDLHALRAIAELQGDHARAALLGLQIDARMAAIGAAL